MKKLFILMLFVAGTLSLNAQQETLFGNVDVWGGFGGPLFELSNINGQFVTSTGGGGALIMNNFFFGGYGLGNDDATHTIESDTYKLKLNHGGLWLGATSNPYKVVHVYGSTRLGWGKTRLLDGETTVMSDRIFAITPEIGFEVNVTNFFQLALTGGYRVITGLENLPGLNNQDMSNVVGGITLRFGGFGGDDDDWDW
ncbi:MAG: hypothetical protein AAFO07_16990 [Bacteroidota bacterium]